jgi:hypothetical protein
VKVSSSTGSIAFDRKVLVGDDRASERGEERRRERRARGVAGHLEADPLLALGTGVNRWSCSSAFPVAAHASTPRARNRRHRASKPCPSSERLRPSRIGSIVQIPNPI